MCDEHLASEEPGNEIAAGAAKVAEADAQQDDASEDHGWVRFLTLTFGDRQRFRRFMAVLLLLLAFLLAAGWLWGAATAGTAAVGAGVLRWFGKRFGG